MEREDTAAALLTVAEVARKLRCSERWVYTLIRDKHLPAKKTGRRWKVKRSALDEYIEGLPAA